MASAWKRSKASIAYCSAVLPMSPRLASRITGMPGCFRGCARSAPPAGPRRAGGEVGDLRLEAAHQVGRGIDDGLQNSKMASSRPAECAGNFAVSGRGRRRAASCSVQAALSDSMKVIAGPLFSSSVGTALRACFREAGVLVLVLKRKRPASVQPFMPGLQGRLFHPLHAAVRFAGDNPSCRTSPSPRSWKARPFFASLAACCTVRAFRLRARGTLPPSSLARMREERT